MLKDITYCRGEGCILTASCRRYTEELSNIEIYFTEPPFTVKETEEGIEFKCELYWEEMKEEDADGN